MNHFPIFLNLEGRRVLLVGAGEIAQAKLRVLGRTTAVLHIHAPDADPALVVAAREAGALVHDHLPTLAEVEGAALVYAASGDIEQDAAIAKLARKAGVLVNVVDNLTASDFITPAIVDRSPVTVAIGTEGAAPVLARAIKADLETRLPQGLGQLAQAGKAFRHHAEALPQGRQRRDFWAEYYFETGPRVLEAVGAELLDHALHDILGRHLAQAPRVGRVDLVGAGPGNPDLLTQAARRLLDRADVVIHDGLVPQAILDLARKEAVFVPVGKTGFGDHTPQDAIHAAMIEHAQSGAQVVRLKAGDPTIFARLDEETAALDAAGIDWAVVPGITAASAAAAAMGASLTRRGRNSDLRIITAHDLDGFAEQDWRALAKPDNVAAIYMGKRAARFVQGRLLMHGADAATPVTAVENASRLDQRILATTLDRLAADLAGADMRGPVVLMLGLAPARATDALTDLLREGTA
jgi:uroporphyrin-III C-methyltransferase / precorrin-2 dehydrogenase / sirohydrochlorin ferrochelatase